MKVASAKLLMRYRIVDVPGETGADSRFEISWFSRSYIYFP